jgi:prepilin-type N-terminal cleavage/methylation domain-containing protein
MQFISKNRTRGFSLLELIVSLAIISIIIALILSGIQKVRVSAKLLESKNKLKQMSLAFLQCNENDTFENHNDVSKGGGNVFRSLLPQLDIASRDGSFSFVPVTYFLSTLDPGMEELIGSNAPLPDGVGDGKPVTIRGTSSYCVNSVLCYECRKMQDITDGASNTILFSERYANCEGFHIFWSQPGTICYLEASPPKRIPCEKGNRRATFADKMYPDFIPIRDERTNRTVGSPENRLFQVRPTLSDCDLSLVQTFTSSGLCVAMADGSVQVIRPSIDPSIFWSAVTPRGGETVPLD